MKKRWASRAGFTKKLAQKNPADPQFLQKCSESYHQGWKLSGQANTYLGINAAFASLMLGQKSQASQIAAEVISFLEAQSRNIAQLAGDLVLDYWDQATLAEAYLYIDPA